MPAAKPSEESRPSVMAVSAVEVSRTAPVLPEAPELVIRPSSGWIPLNLGQLLAYRDLLFFLMWRDIKVRYKQTVLGAAWAFIQPFFTMLVFTLFFGNLGGMSQRTGDIPYPVYVFAALVPWSFFAFALSQASESLVANANLIKKVYFPRLVVPLAAVLAGTVDFLIAFATLIGLLLYFGTVPTWHVCFLPAFMLLALGTSLGVGLWLSALNVQFRDVRYTLTFATQLWLFATPIAYPISIVPQEWRPLYAVNPMVGVVEGFRWALLGSGDAPGPMLVVSTAVSLLVLVSGAYYFRRMERTFSDIA
jgi:lipopolysaccharide transport system permease protein